MIPRLASALAALALAVCCAGCAAEPAPAPSATGFASEEEAFAAAEETYRAYVDALNRVDLSDPKTFEDVYAWTTGDANANERKSLSQMSADRWTVSGQSSFESFEPTSFSLEDSRGIVTAELCFDVEGVMLVDAAGESLVSPSRPNRQPLFVTFSVGESSTGLIIESSEATELPCD